MLGRYDLDDRIALPHFSQAPFFRTTAGSFARITAYFNNEVATGKIPGAIVLIQRRGQPAYYETFSARSVVSKAPMTRDSIFTLKSMFYGALK